MFTGNTAMNKTLQQPLRVREAQMRQTFLTCIAYMRHTISHEKTLEHDPTYRFVSNASRKISVSDY